MTQVSDEGNFAALWPRRTAPVGMVPTMSGSTTEELLPFWPTGWRASNVLVDRVHDGARLRHAAAAGVGSPIIAETSAAAGWSMIGLNSTPIRAQPFLGGLLMVHTGVYGSGHSRQTAAYHDEICSAFSSTLSANAVRACIRQR